MEQGNVKWCSKDRFAAKRLRSIADGLAPAKRTVIEKYSAFRALLSVSPFNIPNELIDYVAENTTPSLREFKVGKKRIVFKPDMVSKVFGIRCGPKPVVLLKRSEQSDLRDVYKGTHPRPDIPIAIKVLSECDENDEDTIIRSWDLLCLGTVVDPGSSNHLGMDYLSSIVDPKNTHEFAWDEYLLDLAMKEVNKIQLRKAKPLVLEAGATKYEFWISGPFALLGIVYMDHLQFPPNEHVINYSVPRVCNVTNADFSFVVANDLDRKILHNRNVFGRRPFLETSVTPYGLAAEQHKPDEEPDVIPSASLNEWLVFPDSQEMEVPACFKHIHDKHKALFSSIFMLPSRV